MPDKLTKDIVESEPAPESFSKLLYDSEVKGFGVRVVAPTDRHPRGARSFFLNYTLNGREGRYTIGRFPDWSVQEARAEAKELRKRIDRGEDITLEKRIQRTAPTMVDLAERYREEDLAGKPAKSQHDNWVHVTAHILPFKPTTRSPKMADRKVTEIHDGDIKALHKAITKAGHPVLANRVLATASAMFSLALKTRAGEDRPWRNAELGNPCKGVERNSEEGRERFFSETEVAAISDALNEYSAQERNHPIASQSAVAAANCIRFIMLTGCRPAEAMKATWKQVDEQPGFWIKPSATVKARKEHRLALSPPAIELLDRLRGTRRKGVDWIFPGQVEGDHLKQLRSCWDFVRERVSSVANDRIYDLRHSFASFGAAGGLSLQIIGKLLGHTQARTTQRYAHLADEAMQAAAAKVGGAIHNAGNGHDKVRHLRGRG
jgi:integrase